MSVGNSIRKGTQWLLVDSIGGQLLRFSFGIALARILVPEDFGLLVTIQVFTGLVGLAASGGMGQALIRAKEADEQDFQVVFTMQLLIGILIYSVFFIIAPWFPDWFDNTIYKDLLRVSAVSFLLRPFVNIHISWLRRNMRFHESTVIRLIAAIFSGAISITMALNGFGVWSLILGGIAGSLLTVILIPRVTPLRTRIRFDLARTRQFGGYGLKVSANGVANYLRRQSSNLIISRLAGADMVGLFNKADSLGTMPFSTIGASIYQPVFREMAKHQDNIDRTKYLFFRSITLLIVYTAPLYIGLCWLADPFIGVVFGPKWIAASEPLQILSAASLLLCIENPCGAVLAAHNRLGRELVIQLISWVFVIIATFIGLQWGLSGVAWGILASRFFATVLMYIIAAQCIITSPIDLLRAIKPGGLLNLILVVVLTAVHFLLPTGYISTSPASYLVVMTLTGGSAYVLALLFLPIQALESESARLRKTLRLGSKAEAS
jgi:teichuronic acid exporter